MAGNVYRLMIAGPDGSEVEYVIHSSLPESEARLLAEFDLRNRLAAQAAAERRGLEIREATEAEAARYRAEVEELRLAQAAALEQRRAQEAAGLGALFERFRAAAELERVRLAEEHRLETERRAEERALTLTLRAQERARRVHYRRLRVAFPLGSVEISPELGELLREQRRAAGW